MHPRPTLPLALLPLLIACSASSSAPTLPTAAQAMARLEAVIGDAGCTSDSQCRSVAVGHRTCGGPELYMAWSTQRSSAQAIEDTVAAFNQASRPALPGRLNSTCVFLNDPGAYCRRAATAASPGRCQLGPPPPAGGVPALPVR